MNFLAPLSFAFAAIIPVIIVLYLLKLKRKKVETPSTLLWRRSIRDMIANTPFQKLRNNLLMYLQILAILLLIFALARPYINIALKKGKSYIILLDTSASMQTEEEKTTRLQLAKDQVFKIIDNMNSNDRMMIITFNQKTEIAQTFTDDKLLLRDIIRTQEAADSKTNVAEALVIINSLMKTEQNSKVFLLSDGCFKTDGLRVNNQNIDFIKIGKAFVNLGITELDIREGFENPDDVQVFAGIENFSDDIESTMLDVKINGQIIDSKRISIAPGKTVSTVFSIPADKEGNLIISIDKADAFAGDNTAYAVVGKQPKINALLVSAGNRYLENALKLDKNIVVEKTEPQNYVKNNNYDIVIFDNFSPKDPVESNAMFFNSIPAGTDIKIKDKPVTQPMIVDYDKTHPIMRFTNIEKTTVAKALSLSLPSAGSQILVETESSPIIATYEDLQKKYLIVGFDLFDSDFPLQVSFPIFISNAVKYISSISSGNAKDENSINYINADRIPRGSLRCGDNIAVVPPGDVASVEITNPKGKLFSLNTNDDSKKMIPDTLKAGFYAINEKDNKNQKISSYNIPVSLLSSMESNIKPQDSIKISGADIESKPFIRKENTEVWKWFAIGAFIILLIEWIIYCRRTWA